jgi:tetratricopeptide (TPR) repeat protein
MPPADTAAPPRAQTFGPPTEFEGRVEALMAQAIESASDVERAEALAGEAVLLARHRSVGEALLGRACGTQAWFRHQLFDYAGSYELALEASVLLERSADALRRNRAVNLCFVICIETGDLIRALYWAGRALAQARAEGDTAQQALLLHNQAVVFEVVEEFDAAIRCMEEAVELFSALPDRAPAVFFSRVNLAEARLNHADRLSAAGHPVRAKEQRRLAEAVLPAFDETANPAALPTWVTAKARLGALAEARSAALVCVQKVRKSGNVRRYSTYALLALGEYHVQNGRPDKGAQRFIRAIAKLRAAENRSHLGQAEQRLASVYAAEGNPNEALRWLRQARLDSARLQSDTQKVRWRLAALERDSARRQRQREEELMHAQRLAVVGRLMAEIYHALAQPLADTQRLLSQCAAEVDGASSPEATPEATREALRRVIERIDTASALARQLKMFSYRAAPHSSEIELHAAVRDAWGGMATWRHHALPPLEPSGDRDAAAQVDAQRLAVLLRILLIEAGRHAPEEAPQVDIRLGDAFARLRLCFANPGAAADPTQSVGVTLCGEIAREMNGTLRLDAVDGRLCFELNLPLPQSRRANSLS